MIKQSKRAESLAVSVLLLSLSISCGKAPSRHTNVSTKYSGTKEEDSSAVKIPQKDVIDKINQTNLNCTGQPLTAKPLLRLMTRDEYQNSIAQILGVKSDYRSALPVEIGVAGFKNNADVGTISDSHLASYLDTAINIADEIRPSLKTLLGCEASEKAVCAKKVVDTLAPLLWRRPLSAEESKELLDLHAKTAASSASEAMTILFARILTSAHFLYRSEIGKSGSLNAYELASALSYYFWGTPPDKTLNDLAKGGTLSNEDVLIAQAERLFADKRSSHLLKNFADGWLGYKKVVGFTKDAATFPKWNDEIQNLLANEAEETFEYFARLPSAHYETLLTSDFSIGSTKLAQYYGAEAVIEDSVNKVKFGSSPRRGILGLGAILSTLASNQESHPFKRGHFVLENLLCVVPDPTPEGASFQPPAIDKTLSTRDRFSQHSSAPQCKSCHIKIDGIGFGMEDFDGAGIYRTTDNGKKVDVSGEVIGADSKTSKFNGTGELSAIVGASSQAKRCFAIQWYRYAQGHIEREEDICAIREVAEQFDAGKLSLGQLIIKTITHAGFQKRGQ